MAVGGRKPTPPHLKAMNGNPGRRPIPENEPDFVPGEISPPDWVHDSVYRVDFLREWERVVAQLRDWGTMGAVNQGALEGICLLYAQFVRAGKIGEATEARQSFDGYRKGLNEFGLTPATKGRSGAKGGLKSNDPADKFFKLG